MKSDYYKKIQRLKKQERKKYVSPKREINKKEKEQIKAVDEKKYVCEECGVELIQSRGYYVCPECGLCADRIISGTKKSSIKITVDDEYIKPEFRTTESSYIFSKTYKFFDMNHLRIYLLLNKFLIQLDLSENQKLMIKDFVMKLKPQSYKEAIISASKHIIKYNMSVTNKEIFNAIKSQIFKAEIIKEIGDSKRDYSWIVSKIINEVKNSFSNEEQLNLYKEFISKYKDINRYKPEIIKKRVIKFLEDKFR